MNTNAATYTVNTLSDSESDGCSSGQCTLREAIGEANAASNFDTINFEPTLNGTIFLNGSQLIISSNLTINGLGARTLAVSGSNMSRVFLIATPLLGGNTETEINDLTITGGAAFPVLNLAGDGGGVLNGALLGIVSGKSTLTLNRVTIRDNFATTLGGGVATRLDAETIITKSLIESNSNNAVPFIPGGDVGGGGISNAALSSTVITNSTITNNQTLAAGGGILNTGGQVHLTNNTIVYNQSGVLGGGVVSIVGVLPLLGVTNLRNTIIAENNALIGAGLISSDVFGILGSFNSLGNNFIGNNTNAEASFEASVFVNSRPMPNAQADIVGNIVITNQVIDPLLGVLQNNGGPTDSHLPSTLSPVINAGNNCVYTNSCTDDPGGKNPHKPLLFDQRGTLMPRIMNVATEIGSIEVPLAPTAAAVSISGQVLDENNRGVYNATVNLTDSNGKTYRSITNPFGYFYIRDVSAGETVIIDTLHRYYTFSTQVLNVSEDISNLNIQVISAKTKENKLRPKFSRKTDFIF